MTCILKYLSILTFSCLCWGTTEGSPFSKAILHSPDPDLRLACKNIRFSWLFAAGDVSSPAAKSEEKRMFSQANLRCLIKFTILPKDLAFLLQKCQHCSPIAPFHFHCFDDNHIFRRRLLFRRIIQALGRKTSRTFYFPRQRRFQKNIIIFELHWPNANVHAPTNCTRNWNNL